MYPLFLRLDVQAPHAGMRTPVMMKREITLPFVPYRGLTITDGEWSTVLGELSWDLQKQAFVYDVPLGEQFALRGIDDASLDDADMALLVSEMEALGWQPE